jgi:hypothetical protein
MKVSFSKEESMMLDSVNASPSARRVIAFTKGLFNGTVSSVAVLREHETPNRLTQYDMGPILAEPSDLYASHHPIESQDARREALAQGKAKRQVRQEKQLGFLLPLSPREKSQQDR